MTASNCIVNLPAIAKSVVEHGLVLLLRGTRHADKVENGNVLRESYAQVIIRMSSRAEDSIGHTTSDTVHGAQLSDTEAGILSVQAHAEH